MSSTSETAEGLGHRRRAKNQIQVQHGEDEVHLSALLRQLKALGAAAEQNDKQLHAWCVKSERRIRQ